MTLWIFLALMAAGAGAIVLYALRPGAQVTPGGNADVMVYKDQLAALNDDLDSERIEASEAESARIEISRRLLAAQEEAGLDPLDRPKRKSSATRAVAIATAGMLFVLVVYIQNGNPDLPGVPFEARNTANSGEESVPQLLARVESHLLDTPDDGRGWDLIAPIYMRMNRFADAADAFANAARLLGPTGMRLAGYGESLAGMNAGVVVQEARDALVQAIELDPTLLRPRFLLTIALEQDGRLAEARDAWQDLLSENPEEGPWRDVLLGRIESLEVRIGDDTGPSQEQVETAQDMSPADRREMVETMVARLAARLEADGDDIDGWLRLVRSYAVLQQFDAARGAIEAARDQFSDDDQALARLAEAARSLGLEE
jgi:cytochrome c-type biogenesis protein CcmH